MSGRTRDEAIYENLHTAIFEVQLPPGTRLPEDDLAETFGVSRTGIRKVLQRLAHERLVEIVPNKGASVAQPSVKEAREVFAARRMIECAALPQVIAHARAAQIKALSEIMEKEDAAQLAGDRQAAIRLSGEFHLALIRIADNDTMSHFLRELVTRSSLIIATYGAPIAVSCRHSEHEQILDLIARRDTAAAVTWMDQHLLEVERSCSFASADAEPDLKAILGNIAKRRGTGLA
ncbi:GntR family transcriptional regulator [Silvimonas iriomotensis]|uniref:GntR family transcriptional regulator n=1 Tax=Silvimonas iriomotensis TaxID=449662 RepID=A0ABQ2PDJ4_9NEIS|nr:GntR family transcriptional regulator [Silvimonas iriomotensis]GGP23433.1 GntR family transcriptional regulator [Silvimonas iriomotensis]